MQFIIPNAGKWTFCVEILTALKGQVWISCSQLCMSVVIFSRGSRPFLVRDTRASDTLSLETGFFNVSLYKNGYIKRMLSFISGPFFSAFFTSTDDLLVWHFLEVSFYFGYFQWHLSELTKYCCWFKTAWTSVLFIISKISSVTPLSDTLQTH